jgi:hypothetical protein
MSRPASLLRIVHDEGPRTLEVLGYQDADGWHSLKDVMVTLATFESCRMPGVKLMYNAKQWSGRYSRMFSPQFDRVEFPASLPVHALFLVQTARAPHIVYALRLVPRADGGMPHMVEEADKLSMLLTAARASDGTPSDLSVA